MKDFNLSVARVQKLCRMKMGRMTCRENVLRKKKLVKNTMSGFWN